MRRIWAAALGVCILLGVSTGLTGDAEAAQGGSWAHINQTLTRPEGWQRFVQQSAFALGEQTEVGELDGAQIYEVGFGGYPSIDGSTVSVPMVMEFARQHLPLIEEDLTGFVFLSTTHNAYEHLILRQPNGSALIASAFAAMDPQQPVDLIIVTQPSDEELVLARENSVTLVQKPVCYDAFVFITHRDNPIESLTVEQIRQIYAGEITNWSQVGGPDAEIAAYQREANSGSQTAMEKLVMRGEPLTAAQPNYVTSGMAELVRRVGDYENRINSLGYTYRYYIDTLYKSDEIKTIAVDGVEPSDINLRNGAYPFATNYFGVIREGDEAKPGGLFLDWMLSEEGQRCIQQAGYIPMNEM